MQTKSRITTIITFLLALCSMTASAQNRSIYQDNSRDNTPMISTDVRRGHNEMMLPPASKEEVKMVVDIIRNTSFDSERLKIAKVCVVLRPMFAEDIAAIARCFSFDDNRLKFLKYAYPYCVDKENTLLLGRVFSFKSNEDKLYDYIRKNHTPKPVRR